jgi:hypothetical protein
MPFALQSPDGSARPIIYSKFSADPDDGLSIHQSEMESLQYLVEKRFPKSASLS